MLKNFEITRTRDGASYGEFCGESEDDVMAQLIAALKAEDRDHEPEGGFTVWEMTP